MSDILQNQLTGGPLNGAELDQRPGGFAWLSRNRQVLVFQTIEDALSSSPPRPDATFDNVVAAYNAVTKTVSAANNGSFSDATLADLENSIRAAGGQIAPGLRSQGEQSVASFRAASFGELGNRYDPVVVDAVQRSLSVYLKSLDIDDLGQVFEAVASFLNPVLHGEDNPSAYAAFQQFDNSIKANVFLTIEDALVSSPPRLEASFDAIVSAFSTERQLLESSKTGSFSENLLKRYESAISAAGGKLYPSTTSSGDASISSYRKHVFDAVNSVLSEDVKSAAEFCLNCILKRLKPADPVALLRVVKTFYSPLIPGNWDSPSFKSFNGLSESKKILVFKTLELIASHSGEYGPPAFQRAVKASTAELAVLEAASFGQLNADVLGDLLDAVVDCGGSVAGGMTAYGPGSIGELLDVFYIYAVKALPQEVFLAANSALNARLRTLSSLSILEVLASAKSFVMPLISTLKQSDFGLKSAEPVTLQVPPAEDSLGSQTQDDEIGSASASSAPHLHQLSHGYLTESSDVSGSVQSPDSQTVDHSSALAGHFYPSDYSDQADAQQFSTESINDVEPLPGHVQESAALFENSVSTDVCESLSVNLVAGDPDDGGHAGDKKKAFFP
jgi:hypothetical protein